MIYQILYSPIDDKCLLIALIKLYIVRGTVEHRNNEMYYNSVDFSKFLSPIYLAILGWDSHRSIN